MQLETFDTQVMPFTRTQHEPMLPEVHGPRVNVARGVVDLDPHNDPAVFAAGACCRCLHRGRETDAPARELLPSDTGEFLAVAQRAADLEARAARRPEDAGHGGVRGIPPRADAHQAVEKGELRRVEHDPRIADEAFEAGMEVRRLKLLGVAGEVPCGNVQRPAQRDSEM